MKRIIKNYNTKVYQLKILINHLSWHLILKLKGAELKDGLLLIDLIKDKPKVNKIKIK